MSAAVAETPEKQINVRVRSRGAGRVATDVPKPRPGWHYTWFALKPGHPSHYSNAQADGFEKVDKAHAREIGMDDYLNAANAVVYGDELILMACPVDNFMRRKADKFRQYREMEGAIEADTEEKLAGVNEEYERRKRGE